MFGLFPLLVIALVVGIVLWARRGQAGAPTVEEVRLPGASPPQGRISLLTEAVVYIGAVLVLAGGFAALQQGWRDFSEVTQLAILGTAALVFLVVGAVVRPSHEPAFQRLVGVAWGISVGAFVGAMVVVSQMTDMTDETAFLVVATSSAAYAAVLWALNQRAIQHAIVFAGILVSAGSILQWAIHDPEPWVVAGTIWALAVAWAVLGWTRTVAPWWVAVPLSIVVALVAPANVGIEWLSYVMGIGTAVAVMAFGVIARFPPGLALGAVGLLGYVIGAVVHYFGDSLGVPAALAITGVLILVLAAVAARLFRSMTGGSRPGGGAGDHTSRETKKAA